VDSAEQMDIWQIVMVTHSAYHYLLMRQDPHSCHPLSNIQAPERDLGRRVL